MPNNYIAPYLISTDRPQNIPSEGIFTVPVCTTKERYEKITNALFAYGAMQGNDFDFDHLVDWLDALPRIVEGCVVFGEQCRSLSRNDSRIVWYPALDAETLPTGYIVNPWVILTGDNPLFGLKAGDVITDILHIPPLPTIYDHLSDIGSILALGYPSITISGITGNGKVRVHLVNILLGGKVITVKDNNLLTVAFLDTNLDAASLPPETYAENILEIDFEGEIEHSLNLVFVPNVNDSFEFLGYGGGFRRVEICGFNQNGGDDMACCDDTNVLLQQILDLLKSGMTAQINFNGGTLIPDIGGGNCAPALFDSDTGETDPEELTQREKALCMTVERYIQAIFLLAITEMSGASTMIDMVLGQFPVTSIPTFLKLSVVYPSGFIGLNAFFDALLLPDAMKDIACNMVSQLKGQNNTFQNFRDSLLAETSELGKLINTSNGLKLNYTLFNEALEMANDDNLNDYTCPCGIGTDCEEPLDMIFKNDRGISITNVGGNLYHIIGGHKFGSGGEFGGVYLQDSANRCFALEIPTGSEEGLPEGWTGVQPTTYHFVVGCCGSSDHSGGGGWENGAFTEAYWDCGDTTDIDTYYILRCLGTECE